jgi:hypothetical protein
MVRKFDEMQNPVYADCRWRRREKRDYFYTSSTQEGKGNITVTIEEFAAIVDEEIKKSIYSLT